MPAHNRLRSTTSTHDRASHNRESQAKLSRAAASIRRGFAPRSLKSASYRRRTRFSASIDRRGLRARNSKPIKSATTRRPIRARAITPDMPQPASSRPARSVHVRSNNCGAQVDRVEALLQHNANRRATFADCAARYLADAKDKRSIEATAWHIRLLIPYVGSLNIHRIHDGTLQSFISDRLASGVTAVTINRSLDRLGAPPLQSRVRILGMFCRKHFMALQARRARATNKRLPGRLSRNAAQWTWPRPG